MRQGDLDPGNPLIARAVGFANELVGFPRHLSQHVGGFVLTRDRLDEIVPIGNAAMEDRTFIEWDKDDIDALRMMKVDVLALGMLTCIRKAFELMKDAQQCRYARLRPSRAKIRPSTTCCARRFDRRVPGRKPGADEHAAAPKPAEILRSRHRSGDRAARPHPGRHGASLSAPAQRHGKSGISFAVAGARPGGRTDRRCWARRKGVPLFQEQAMKLAIVAAKFTPEEANGLRRAMATFRNLGTIHTFGDKMVGNMVRAATNAISPNAASSRSKASAPMAFPKAMRRASRSWSMSRPGSNVITRRPSPARCLNSQPMGFYAPAEIVRDAREHGVEVRAIDVSFSEWDNTLEPREDGTLALRLGFRQMDGFREEWAEALIAARTRGLA